jgi:hypothetical protein
MFHLMFLRWAFVFASASCCLPLLRTAAWRRFIQTEKVLDASLSKSIVPTAVDSFSLGLDRTEASPLLLRNQR